MKTTEEIEKLQEMINLQCSDGNWNYSEYMFGMANGMIYAKSVLTGENPEFLDAPESFLCDIDELRRFNNSGVVVKHTEELNKIIVNTEADDETD